MLFVGEIELETKERLGEEGKDGKVMGVEGKEGGKDVGGPVFFEEKIHGPSDAGGHDGVHAGFKGVSEEERIEEGEEGGKECGDFILEEVVGNEENGKGGEEVEGEGKGADGGFGSAEGFHPEMEGEVVGGRGGVVDEDTDDF